VRCAVCGVWYVACGVWFVACGVWCVVCGLWCVVCGVWCVACGVWRVVCVVWCVQLTGVQTLHTTCLINNLESIRFAFKILSFFLSLTST
jgi:hypothetical protein